MNLVPRSHLVRAVQSRSEIEMARTIFRSPIYDLSTSLLYYDLSPFLLYYDLIKKLY